MSRDQRYQLDARLHKTPQPSGQVPVERMREGFATFMGSFLVSADVQRRPTELAGRPAVFTQAQAERNFLKTMRPTSLLGRFTTTDEVANMVVYVCSEQASGTTGAALRVDGGVLRQIA